MSDTRDPDDPPIYIDTTPSVVGGKLTASIGLEPPEPDDDPPNAQVA